MNVNFGLFPPVDGKARKADRKRAYTDRARAALAEWLASENPPRGEAVGRGTMRSMVEG
jgi:methylenetetrahydrofolate--tRNA-(uracil-5-)-methyltransferase